MKAKSPTINSINYRIPCSKGKSILLWLFCSAASCVFMANGGNLKQGDNLEKLESKCGTIYESVRVLEIQKHALRIMHRDGVARISSDDLPQYAEIFAAIPEDVVEYVAAPAVLPQNTHSQVDEVDAATTVPSMDENQGEPQWMPTSIDDVMDCSLIVTLHKKLTSDGNESAGSGSAFLVNHGKTTYIYTNVHNFDGTSKAEITDRHGKQYNDFVSVEVAADGFGYWEPKSWGGDIMRIRLREYRENALTIDSKAINASNHGSRKIVVTGNTRGQGVITRLEGIIQNVDDNGIIHHTALTEEGNSGSPIVDMESLMVIGILTWGNFDSTDPLDYIWKKVNPEPHSRQAKAFGASLAGVKYTPYSFQKLVKQREIVNDLKKMARLMGLMDLLIPTKQGLFIDRNRTVMGDYKISDIFQESANHPVLKDLAALDRLLNSSASSNIGMSNPDMLKAYIETYRRCLGHIQNQRNAFGNLNELSFYTKCILRNTRSVEIVMAYQRNLATMIQWCEQQRGTAGRPMPLTQRMRLPSFTDGLSALGIQEE